MRRPANRILALMLSVLMLTASLPSLEVFAEPGPADKGGEISQELTDNAESTGDADAGAAVEAAPEDQTSEDGSVSGSEEVPGEAGDTLGIQSYYPYGGPVEQIVRSMTLREKICQCLMMDFRTWKGSDGVIRNMTVLEDDVADALADYRFGAVILFDENIKETEDTLRLTKDMQAAAMSKGGLPLIIATDQEGGRVIRLASGTALPGNMAAAATEDTGNAKASAEIIGRELGVLGINTTMAPVADVNSNAGNPIIGVRSFGDDADIVGRYTVEFLKGLEKTGSTGCVKHFPGHGDTDTDSHTGLPKVDKTKEELYESDLKPFREAIDSGADMIMTAHILYPKVDSSKIYSVKTKQEESRPATMSKTILTGILRGEMGYDGIVVTDAMDMKGVSNNFTRGQAAYEALMAGADIICMPVEKSEGGFISTREELDAELESLITYIEKKLKKDPSGKARLDEAVTRIVKLKQEKGILDYDADDYTAEKALAEVGSKKNRGLEREMTAKAVTVVRNDNNFLPYRPAKDDKVLFLCPYDNERAQMVMGLNRAKAAGIAPASVEPEVYRFSADDAKDDSVLKEKIDRADLVIINSEAVDLEDMSLGWYTTSVTKKVTEYCKSKEKRSVVMSVNIPYDVQLYPDADAVLLVYGCKGSTMDVTQDLIDGKITEDTKACGPNIIAGVEAVFGVNAVSGKLPVNIPEFISSGGSGSYTDKILYERGFGITYDRLEPAPAKDNSEQTVSAPVVLKMPKIRSLKKGRRRLTVKMASKPSATGGSGYQAAYREKGSGDWQYSSSSSKSFRLRNLKKGRRYIVMVRSYRTDGGVTYYSSWSRARTSGKVR